MATSRTRKSKTRKSPSAALEKRAVFEGRKQRTKSGLTKADLMMNKRGVIVSKAKYEAGVRLYLSTLASGKLAAPFQSGRRGGSRW